MRAKIFRWKAIGPLLLVLLLLGTVWLIFGDIFVEDTSEEVTTKLLGTQVDISGLRLHETKPRVDIGGIQVADPFDLNRNVLETGATILELDAAALLEKKVVVNQLRIQDLRFGTRRSSPAQPVSGDGFAPTLLREMRRWSSQFDVPLLKLTPIDTVRSLVLDPGQLSTVKEAEAVIARADSLRGQFVRTLDSLDIRPTLDSARAVAQRLANANPRQLGIAGTRQAVQDVRRTLQSVEQVRARVRSLEQGVEAGIGRLGEGVRSVDEARQRDYAFARSLLQLPSFDAPDIGAALFGRVSVHRFEKAVYWAELAQQYLPPGLKARIRPARKRLRMDGTTVGFPKERDYPGFLLRRGEVNLTLTAFGGTHTLAASLSGLTTEPALYGSPAIIRSSGRIGGDHPMSIQASAVLDHSGRVAHDSIQAQLRGVPLPSLTLPGLPFTLQPGTGTSALAFDLRGDQLRARWSMLTTTAQWQVDSSAGRSLGTVENLIWRVLSGLSNLEVVAELNGSLRSPRLTVRSNLDDAIANRVRSLLGEELQAAEARVRARVDSLVAEKVSAVRARAGTVTAELRGRVTEVRQEVERVKTDLESRLKALTSLGGVLNLD
jgi:uncharacterized protein (TIGR03545 family)